MIELNGAYYAGGYFSDGSGVGDYILTALNGDQSFRFVDVYKKRSVSRDYYQRIGWDNWQQINPLYFQNGYLPIQFEDVNDDGYTDIVFQGKSEYYSLSKNEDSNKPTFQFEYRKNYLYEADQAGYQTNESEKLHSRRIRLIEVLMDEENKSTIVAKKQDQNGADIDEIYRQYRYGLISYQTAITTLRQEKKVPYRTAVVSNLMYLGTSERYFIRAQNYIKETNFTSYDDKLYQILIEVQPQSPYYFEAVGFRRLPLYRINGSYTTQTHFEDDFEQIANAAASYWIMDGEYVRTILGLIPHPTDENLYLLQTDSNWWDDVYLIRYEDGIIKEMKYLFFNSRRPPRFVELKGFEGDFVDTIFSSNKGNCVLSLYNIDKMEMVTEIFCGVFYSATFYQVDYDDINGDGYSDIAITSTGEGRVEAEDEAFYQEEGKVYRSIYLYNPETKTFEYNDETTHIPTWIGEDWWNTR